MSRMLHDRKSVLAAVLGTVVEYYDYSLYGFTAAVFANYFFPQNDPSIALLQTFGVFAMGSIAKPIGALIFGRIGDKYGRQPALRINMLGIAVPTVIVGLLPGYEQWGWISPFILLVCRVIQGIFVAGEADGVRIFLLEHFPKHRACLAISFSLGSMAIGSSLASWASAIAVLPHFPSWAWRIPFFLGGLLGILAFMMRKNLTETPAFLEYKEKRQEKDFLPLTQAIRNNWRAFLVTIGLCGAMGGSYHFYMIFFGTYLHKMLGIFDSVTASFNISLAIGLYTLCVPVSGLIADRIGMIRTLKIALAFNMGMAAVNALCLKQGYFNLGIMLTTTVGMSLFHVPVFALLGHQFKVGERYRCLSLGHTIGSMLLSGTTPAIATFIVRLTDNLLSPMVYFISLMILGRIALFMVDLREAPSSPETNEELARIP